MIEGILVYDTTQNNTIQQENSVETGDWSVTTYQESLKRRFCMKNEKMKTLFPLLPISPFLGFDSSSVMPHFHPKIETSILENKLSEKSKVINIPQNDVIFKMPPVSRLAVTVKIRSVKEAEPHILKPEEV